MQLLATAKRNSWIAVPFLAVAILLGAFGFAKANPLDIGLSNNTATTTIAYITTGNSTTYTYDLWAGGSAEQVAADNMALAVQLTASSTSSVITWKYQFSENGIDWYDDNTSFLATTSPASNVTTGQTYVWTAAGTATAGKIVVVPASPTRYIRATFTASGANSGVWASFVSNKQQAN